MKLNTFDMVSYQSSKHKKALKFVKKGAGDLSEILKTSELIKKKETLMNDKVVLNQTQNNVKFAGKLKTLDEFMRDVLKIDIK